MAVRKQKSKSHKSLSRYDGGLWADRCRHWAVPDFKPARFKNTPRRHHEPLVITGHGSGLHVNHGALCIRDGFTHYSQKRTELRFFPKDPNMPSRITVVDGSGSITFDALDWLAAQHVPFIRIDWRGGVQTALGGIGYSANQQKIARQLEWKRTGRGLEIARTLIGQKVENSIKTLTSSLPSSTPRKTAIDRLCAIKQQLSSRMPTTIRELLGREGNAAIVYFDAWQHAELQWKGTGRRPIPQDWYRIGFRSSHARKRTENRNASHPVNAMLNYAYAVLQSQVQVQTISTGYDPTIGVLHANLPGRLSFVLDLMEPLRPLVDRVLLTFVQGQTFQPTDFTIRPDGVCRLNPELARQIVRICNSINSNGAMKHVTEL